MLGVWNEWTRTVIMEDTTSVSLVINHTYSPAAVSLRKETIIGRLVLILELSITEFHFKMRFLSFSEL